MRLAYYGDRTAAQLCPYVLVFDHDVYFSASSTRLRDEHENFMRNRRGVRPLYRINVRLK